MIRIDVFSEKIEPEIKSKYVFLDFNLKLPYYGSFTTGITNRSKMGKHR